MSLQSAHPPDSPHNIMDGPEATISHILKRKRGLSQSNAADCTPRKVKSIMPLSKTSEVIGPDSESEPGAISLQQAALPQPSIVDLTGRDDDDGSVDDYELNDEQHDRLMIQLQRLGPEVFERDCLASEGIDLQEYGLAVGIDPQWAIDEDLEYVEYVRQYLQSLCNKRRKLAKYNTIDDIVKLMKSSRNILVITGAGISTSLGIPDFRSKVGGFYSKLRDLGMEEPEEVFDIFNFDHDPGTFYSLADDILPKNNRYTPTHAFIRLLQNQNRLLRNYTQNIDNLEGSAGVIPDRLLQCHGSFATATCRKCAHQVPGEEIFDEIRGKRIAKCKACIRRISEASPKHQQITRNKTRNFDDYNDDIEEDDLPTPGVMKPDITFFGEKLPDTFFEHFSRDKLVADLVIVIGTSMQVGPVAEMPDAMAQAGRNEVPMVYVGREACDHIEFDVQLLGDCDTVVWELAIRCGWGLVHEMVPAAMEVEVTPVEEERSHWRVVQKRAEVKEA